MKRTIHTTCHAWLLALLLLCTGCYDSSFKETEGPTSSPAVTTTIAALNGLYEGDLRTIEAEIVVAGRVTANTRGGNFYRSVHLEADGAAVEVLVGIDALHNDYPIGAEIILTAKGLAIARSYGELQIGAAPIDPALGVEPLGSKAAADQHLFRTSAPHITPTPQTVTLDQLTPALAGTLCRIEGLQPAPEGADEDRWEGEHRFTDEHDRAIFTYTRTYADWAEKSLPKRRCTLIGILQYDATGEGRYRLKLRHEGDIQ
ncbi:MAG: hypothetical protein IKZ12_06215 [Alistipes sp.]|nr:hypothetical protein [Alistipes sp.]